MFRDEFGDRMKGYEAEYDIKLQTKVPVFIRIDGKAFHTWTKGLQKPFDAMFITSMQLTLKDLCENIEGCVFGYTQSDEITLVLADYQRPETAAWFGYRVQKMCSVAASMATKYFGKHFTELVMGRYEDEYFRACEEGNIDQENNIVIMASSDVIDELPEELQNSDNNVVIIDDYISLLLEKTENLPCFDARCFNVPLDDVVNAVYWRQSDAIRNSIQACGQSLFSHKELQNKSCSQIKEMLANKGEPWEDLPDFLQRGTACRKVERTEITKTEEGFPHIIIHKDWELDFEMPVLLGANRKYVEDLITFKEV